MNIRDNDGYKLNDNKMIIAIPVSGSFDNVTVKVGRFPFNGEIVAISFATGAALGASAGIDVKAGSNVVVSSSNNLNGYELKTTGLSNTSITSATELSIVFDDFTAATQCVVIIYIQQKP
jgi:hypothetical protein